MIHKNKLLNRNDRSEQTTENREGGDNCENHALIQRSLTV
jgi:hypothetical protein